MFGCVLGNIVASESVDTHTECVCVRVCVGVCGCVWMVGSGSESGAAGSPQRENFRGLKVGRASWGGAVRSSSMGASSSAEPHFFLE